jgi:hypothetical protein
LMRMAMSPMGQQVALQERKLDAEDW